MNIYLRIYNNLCYKKQFLFEKWQKGSGIHRHHIIPRHSGGLDENANYTYLSVREHVIAHFLLWKIYKNPNDLNMSLFQVNFISHAGHDLVWKIECDTLVKEYIILKDKMRVIV